MKFFFHKFLGIYPNEIKKSLFFSFLAFICAFGISSADILSTSYFIEKMGSDQLPLAFIIKAVCILSFSSLFLHLLNKKIRPSLILQYVLLAAGLTYLCASFLSPSFSGIFWMILHILSYVFEASLIACLWTFFDRYHIHHDAKRIYGFYNASYYAGAICSGTLINMTIDAIGSKTFLVLISAALIMGFLILKKMTKNLHTQLPNPKNAASIEEKKPLLQIFQNIFKSPYVVFLLLMSFIIQLLITTTTYNFMDTFSRIFNASASAANENILAQFLGKWNAFIAGGNIIIGMFFYRRGIKKLGLGNMILLPPLCFAFLYFNWLFFDTLLLGILGLIMVNGILYTIEDNNFNLLMNAATCKYQSSIRIINDLYFEASGMLVSSLILLAFNSRVVCNFLGISLCIAFILISYKVKRNYQKSQLNTPQVIPIKQEHPISEKEELIQEKASSWI